MMENKFWNKIKEVFKKISGKKEKVLLLNSRSKNFSERGGQSDFITQISIQEELRKKHEQSQMAQKLLNYELFPSELSEKETEEMIKYFKKDIKEIDIELEKIKKHIISIKLQLE